MIHANMEPYRCIAALKCLARTRQHCQHIKLWPQISYFIPYTVVNMYCIQISHRNSCVLKILPGLFIKVRRSCHQLFFIERDLSTWFFTKYLFDLLRTQNCSNSLKFIVYLKHLVYGWFILCQNDFWTYT